MCCPEFYYSHVAHTFHYFLHPLHGGRDCLVMPPSNFALLGLKDRLEGGAVCFHQHTSSFALQDTFHMLLKAGLVL